MDGKWIYRTDGSNVGHLEGRWIHGADGKSLGYLHP
jgi:hypothetical protein